MEIVLFTEDGLELLFMNAFVPLVSGETMTAVWVPAPFRLGFGPTRLPAAQDILGGGGRKQESDHRQSFPVMKRSSATNASLRSATLFCTAWERRQGSR